MSDESDCYRHDAYEPDDLPDCGDDPVYCNDDGSDCHCETDD